MTTRFANLQEDATVECSHVSLGYLNIDLDPISQRNSTRFCQGRSLMVHPVQKGPCDYSRLRTSLMIIPEVSLETILAQHVGLRLQNPKLARLPGSVWKPRVVSALCTLW